MATILRRIDQSQNIARFYELDVQLGLFGDVSVTRHWGRIGSNGQSKQHWFPTETAANDLGAKLQRQKERRGYMQIAPSPNTRSSPLV
ncbi:WGR domain-containing protein [Asticcacaulis sp. W401b]|uniref:WGR domain-containing protein n=1 Tax=Asticcacaulis sp. W401b TaxID=3388666 RepID=UPI003970A943